MRPCGALCSRSPLSYLALLSNSGWSQPPQRNVPARFSCGEATGRTSQRDSGAAVPPGHASRGGYASSASGASVQPAPGGPCPPCPLARLQTHADQRRAEAALRARLAQHRVCLRAQQPPPLSIIVAHLHKRRADLFMVLGCVGRAPTCRAALAQAMQRGKKRGPPSTGCTRSTHCSSSPGPPQPRSHLLPPAPP